MSFLCHQAFCWTKIWSVMLAIQHLTVVNGNSQRQFAIHIQGGMEEAESIAHRHGLINKGQASIFHCCAISLSLPPLSLSLSLALALSFSPLPFFSLSFFSLQSPLFYFLLLHSFLPLLSSSMFLFSYPVLHSYRPFSSSLLSSQITLFYITTNIFVCVDCYHHDEYRLEISVVSTCLKPLYITEEVHQWTLQYCRRSLMLVWLMK